MSRFMAHGSSLLAHGSWGSWTPGPGPLAVLVPEIPKLMSRSRSAIDEMSYPLTHAYVSMPIPGVIESL